MEWRGKAVMTEFAKLFWQRANLPEIWSSLMFPSYHPNLSKVAASH
jgi:hypothetical protein